MMVLKPVPSFKHIDPVNHFCCVASNIVIHWDEAKLLPESKTSERELTPEKLETSNKRQVKKYEPVEELKKEKFKPIDEFKKDKSVKEFMTSSQQELLSDHDMISTAITTMQK